MNAQLAYIGPTLQHPTMFENPARCWISNIAGCWSVGNQQAILLGSNKMEKGGVSKYIRKFGTDEQLYKLIKPS